MIKSSIILKQSLKFYNLTKRASKTINISQSAFDKIKNFALTIFVSWANQQIKKNIDYYKSIKKNTNELEAMIKYGESLAEPKNLNFSSLPAVFTKTINIDFKDLPDNYPINKLEKSKYNEIKINIIITGQSYGSEYVGGSWSPSKKQIDINFFGTNKPVQELMDYKARIDDLNNFLNHELKHFMQSAILDTINNSNKNIETITLKLSNESKNILNFFQNKDEGFIFDEDLIKHSKWSELNYLRKQLSIPPGQKININSLSEIGASDVTNTKKKFEEWKNNLNKFVSYIKNNFIYYLKPEEFDTWIYSSKHELLIKYH